MLHSKIPSLNLNGTIMSDKPCTKSLGLPNISFSLGEASKQFYFEIPYQRYAFNNSENKCELLFRIMPKNSEIDYQLGQPFLQSFSILLQYSTEAGQNQIGFGEKFWSGASIKGAGIVADSKQEEPPFYAGGVQRSTPSVAPTPVPDVPAAPAVDSTTEGGGAFGTWEAYLLVLVVTLVAMGFLLVCMRIRKERRTVRLPS